MADGAEWEAQTLNPDILRYERTAAKYKWPGPTVSPVTWMTFVAWSAGLREGHLPEAVTWEIFAEQCLEVRSAGDDAVRPTGPGPDTD
jgi:hypothetical protein